MASAAARVEYLATVDWATIGVQLAAYAAYVARCYRWGVGGSDAMAQGVAAEDLAATAIRKLWTGERRWSPQRQPDLLSFLKGVVKSEMSHLLERSATRHEARYPVDAEGKEAEALLATRARCDAPFPPTPEEEWLRREEIASRRARIAELRRAVATSPELEALIDAIQAGCSPRPRFLATYLEIPVSSVNNRLKRLRRLALGLREEGRSQRG
jgi:DNA-directed RNA polymerase specialized sigma24 family protein